MANNITLIRVLLALIALAIVQLNPLLNLIASGLIIVSLLLDALDGYIARRLKTSSLQGGVLDILADRIIENIFFIFYASVSLFSVGFALIIMIRGLTIDAIRTIFVAQGKTAFGNTSLHTLPWTKLLACSRLSRATYNTLKLITFVSYAQLLAPNGYLFHFISFSTLQIFSQIALWGCISMALIRAIPVIYEALISLS